MAEAILLRNLPDGLGEVYVWKKYEVVENISYKWNRWNVVSTTTYRWNKWNTTTGWTTEVTTGGVTLTDTQSWSGGTLCDVWYYTSAPSISNSESTNPDAWHFKRPTERIRYNVNGTVPSSWYNSSWYFTNADNLNPSTQWISGISSITTKTSGSNVIVTFSGSSKGTVANVTSKGDTSYGQVTSTSSSAYPSNGVSGSYWYESAGSSTSYSKGSTQYSDVTSIDPNAYPNGYYSGSYWYDNRQEVITYSMGSYIEDVFSTNPQRYPTNGIDGAYWYVLQS